MSEARLSYRIAANGLRSPTGLSERLPPISSQVVLGAMFDGGPVVALPTQIVHGWDDAVAEWVRRRLPEVEGWGPKTALGIAIGNQLVAGVVYNRHAWPTIEASIASSSPRWCSRRNLAAIFAYPFRQLQCRRFGATTGARNRDVRLFLTRLGFREEGIARLAFPTDDAVIYGMTPPECRWLHPVPVAEEPRADE